ncbi:MAG: chemotaxis response regulator protein-glutamate methylesterase [Bdellovibrionales bacterium]|nr:chemotaxis response regulator protein-glutamate methylesterase [Bdellovibrionales bacterium]
MTHRPADFTQLATAKYWIGKAGESAYLKASNHVGFVALVDARDQRMGALLWSVGESPETFTARCRELVTQFQAGMKPGSPIEAKFVASESALATVAGLVSYFQQKLGAKILAKECSGAEFILQAPESKVKVSYAPAARKCRVLIVDDSKTIRDLLKAVLSSDANIDVVAEASMPNEVEGLIQQYRPDVITLDLQMPQMNGVELLRKIMPKMPIPTVLVTSMSLTEGRMVLEALEAGAVDYIQKPRFEELKMMAPIIVEKVLAASTAKLTRSQATPTTLKSRRLQAPLNSNDNSVILIGSSTGGPQALRSLLGALPASIPPIVIVQHIPAVFSKALADSLTQACAFPVLEAKDGDEVKAGQALMAPGGMQMEILRSSAGVLTVKVFDGAPVNRHKPSVDVLFQSGVKALGRRAVGVILTGMGADGAKGLLALRQAGARTVAEHESSCIVYGMPREAIKIGAAEDIAPLEDIPLVLQRLLARSKKAA